MYERVLKRLIDMVIAILAMPLVGLSYIIVAPLIYLEDGAPIFYNAERIGKDGKFFKMYKYRSMRNNAPDLRLADGSTYNGEDDPRVTRIGKVLRKTSVDELPQLWNILKGDMSLVGPRPDPVDWLEKYPPEVKVFLNVRPGITGYSQAYYRNAADGETKMKNDVYYAQNCSLFLDLKIFFKTIAVVLGRENTYKDTSLESNLLDNDSKAILEKLQ